MRFDAVIYRIIFLQITNNNSPNEGDFPVEKNSGWSRERNYTTIENNNNNK